MGFERQKAVQEPAGVQSGDDRRGEFAADQVSMKVPPWAGKMASWKPVFCVT